MRVWNGFCRKKSKHESIFSTSLGGWMPIAMNNHCMDPMGRGGEGREGRWPTGHPLCLCVVDPPDMKLRRPHPTSLPPWHIIAPTFTHPSLSLSLSLVFYSTFTLSAMIPKTQEALKNEAIDRSSVTVKSQTPTIDLNVYQWTKCFYYMSACSKAPRLKKSWFREEKRWGGVERVSAERKWRVVSLSLSRCAVSVVVTGTAKWAN